MGLKTSWCKMYKWRTNICSLPLHLAMTDASAFTAFTRYTIAPTTSTVSRTTKRSSRSKRKMERKVGSGRKGTVDEEEYLLKSLTKLAGRLATAQGACLTFLLLFKPAERRGLK